MGDPGVVLVTGGSGVLGSAIAVAAARDGWRVAVGCQSAHERAQAVLEAVSRGRRGCLAPGDVTDPIVATALVEAARETLGDITAVVCAAGIVAAPRRWTKTPWTEFEAHWRIQVQGTWNIVGAVLPGMIARKRGVIVIVASAYARDVPPAFLAPYVTAKHALVGMARSLAVEMAPHGIALHVVSPSLTRSPMTASLPESFLEAAAQAEPTGRLATPEDTAGAVAVLLRSHAPTFPWNEIPAGGR